MSIYCTLWELKFPKDGHHVAWADTDEHWVVVIAQAVPQHIGCPSYEQDDCHEFLPPPVAEDSPYQRAVVFVAADAEEKGTKRHGQEYVNPLLVISGEEYAKSTFDELHTRLCDAIMQRQPKKRKKKNA